MKITLHVMRTPTPLGEMLLGFTDKGLAVLEYADKLDGKRLLPRASDLIVREAEDERALALAVQLQEYFAGARRQFDVVLDMVGTDFQRRVWQTLLQIPYGETWSYGQQAAFLGDSKAVRAVAGANARNPVSIVVPCHRVIGGDGRLTGYAGGMARKEALLRLEGADFRY